MTQDGSLDSLYDKQLAGFRTHFDPGEKVEGSITAITRDYIFLDINTKSDGIIKRADLDDATVADLKVGDNMSAYFIGSRGGEIELATRFTNDDGIDESLAQAFNSGIPIDGKVSEERKGGYQINVGDTRGFCPYSQIDLFRSEDSSVHVGQRYTFLIVEYSEDNLVLSRRAYLERQQQEVRGKLQERLKVNDVVRGTVSRCVDFGAFVDIGGIEGLVPMRELAWERVESSASVLTPGDSVHVKILSLDWDANRFSLSIKQAAGDPWNGVKEAFHISGLYHGKVVRLMPFGAFVQLKPGVEGLIHISKLGDGKRLEHASEVLKEQEELDVYVENIDFERRRISLVLENPQLGRTMGDDDEGEALTIGEVTTGKVQDIKQFGVFIQLTPTKTGLLHVSEIAFTGSGNRFKEMWKQFPPESEVQVIVKSIHQNRISLVLPNTQDDDEDYSEYIEENQGDFGGFGSMLDGLKL